MLWPDNRNKEDDEEEEKPMEVPPLEVNDRGTNDDLLPNPAALTQVYKRRASESEAAYSRRTQTELDFMQRNQRAADLKKEKAEQERQEKERKRAEKREKARKLREAAKKAGKKPKKKKKAKKAIPAAACTPGDVVLSQKGIAVVRWKGKLHFRPNDTEWLGIEFLDEPLGKNDGTVKGCQYFKTKPKHGSFVKSVKQRLQPEEILRKLGAVKSELSHKEREIIDIRDQMDHLIESHEEQLKLQDDADGPGSPTGRLLSLHTTRSLNLVKSISGKLDSLDQTPVDLVLNLGSVYYEDDSSSEYEYSMSDEEEEDVGTALMKADRKKLVDVRESKLYTEGSLRRIQTEMVDAMNELKNDQSGFGKPPAGKKPVMKRQGTFAGTKSLGLELPELHASAEEVEEWIRDHLAKAPGCPNFDNQQVLSALIWAMRAFLNLNESHTY